MKFALTAAVLASAAAVAQAQLANAPACFLTCFQSTLSSSGTTCGAADLACLCKDTKFQLATVSCLQSSCPDPSALTAAEQTAGAACAAAGITIDSAAISQALATGASSGASGASSAASSSAGSMSSMSSMASSAASSGSSMASMASSSAQGVASSAASRASSVASAATGAVGGAASSAAAAATSRPASAANVVGVSGGLLAAALAAVVAL